MPLTTLSAAAALANMAGPAARWPANLADTLTVGLPPARSGFQLEPGEAVFTAGARLAREIERGLAARGFELPARLGLGGDGDPDDQVLDRETPQAILNELRWALDPDADFPEAGFLRAGEAALRDPCSGGHQPPAPIATLKARRAQIEAAYREAVRCRAVMLALGRAEAWFDSATGLHLNEAPPPAAVRAEPDRFLLHHLSIEDIEATLEAILALLQARGRADVRLILMVCPAPLPITYTGAPVVAADAYGKSVLRAAAERLAARNPAVDYFPAYDIVAVQDRASAFSQDNRHIVPAVADAVVARLLEAYGPQGSATRTLDKHEARAARTQIKQAQRAQDPRGLLAALRLLEDAESRALAGYTESEFHFLVGYALRHTDRPEEAVAPLDLAHSLDPDSAAILYNLGAVRAQLGQHGAAEAAFARAAALAPAEPRYALRYARALIRNQRHREARKVLAALGAHPEAEALVAQIADRG